MNKRIIDIFLIIVTLMVAGCSTPASRIKKNPDLFASFPPEVQANVRKGVIEIGYTKGMVYLAFGRPNSIYERKTDMGITEVWSYTDYHVWTEYEPLESWYYYRDVRGNLHRIRDLTWINRSHTSEYESLRVEFDGDKVKAIEKLRS
jgi:outer membrane protein assembly factor BamE (lipoprotein component of BamABCDE complex)